MWTGLDEAWPWFRVRGAHPASEFHRFPAGSAWDLLVAAAVFVLGLALSILIYRRRNDTSFAGPQQFG